MVLFGGKNSHGQTTERVTVYNTSFESIGSEISLVDGQGEGRPHWEQAEGGEVPENCSESAAQGYRDAYGQDHSIYVAGTQPNCGTTRPLRPGNIFSLAAIDIGVPSSEVDRYSNVRVTFFLRLPSIDDASGVSDLNADNLYVKHQAADGAIVNADDLQVQTTDGDYESISNPINRALREDETNFGLSGGWARLTFTAPKEALDSEIQFLYDATGEAGFEGAYIDAVTVEADRESNTPPTASDDPSADGAYETEEGQTLRVSESDGVLANDNDPNGDPLTASVAERPSNGSLSLDDDGSFSYTPDVGFSGSDQFTYEASDGRGGTATATATIEVASAPALSNPRVSPSTGTTDDTFTFRVDYQSGAGTPPDDVNLILDGTSVDLQASSSDYQAGVTYTATQSGLSASTHEYHFTGTAGGRSLRAPASGSQLLSVTQSAVGYDLEVSSATLDDASPGAGSSFDVTINVSNTGEEPFGNVPLSAELTGPGGGRLDASETTVSLNPGENVFNTLTLQVPEGASDGQYQVAVRVRPELDEEPSDNQVFRSFTIGEELDTGQYEIAAVRHVSTDPDAIREDPDFDGVYSNLQGPEVTIDGSTFRVEGIAEDDILLRDPAGNRLVVDEGEVRYAEDAGAALAVEQIDIWSDTQRVVYIWAGPASTRGPSFDSREVSVRRGETATLSASAPSSGFFEDVPEDVVFTGHEDSETSAYRAWYDRQLDLGSGGARAALSFDVPSDAPIQSHGFGVLTRHEGTPGAYLTEVGITVEGVPDIALGSSSLSTSVEEGQTAGRGLTIENTGSASLSWSLSASDDWIAAGSTSGGIAPGGSATIDLTVGSSDLAPGTYNGEVVISSNDPDEDPVVVSVSHTVSEVPLPDPRIVSVDVPTEVAPDDSIDVQVVARNDGGRADYGSISVSFPGLREPGDSSLVTPAGTQNYSDDSAGYVERAAQDSLYDRSGTRVEAEYLLAEVADQDWPSGEQDTLQLSVQPPSTGPFTVQVRSTMTVTVGDEDRSGTSPESAPSEDQQGWPVQRRTVDVAAPEATVAGTVRYYDDPASPVSGAEVALRGDSSRTTQTGDDGTFRFSVPTGRAYTLAPTGTGGDPQRGVTTLDLARIRRAVLGLDSLGGPYARLAADVDDSESITTVDVARGRRVILGTTDSLPGGNWQFVPARYRFGDSDGPFGAPADLQYNPLQGSQSDQDFIAIRNGDVDASWASARTVAAATAADGSNAEARAAGPPVSLSVSDASTAVDDTVTVAVKAGSFRNVGGMQFTLAWSPEALTYLGAASPRLQGFAAKNVARHPGDGRLSVAWTHPSGTAQTIPSRETVLELRFKTKAAGEARIRFGSEPTPALAHGEGASRGRPLSGTAGRLQVRELPDDFRLGAPYPNPAREAATVSYALPEAERVAIAVYDLLGRRVATAADARKEAGRHEVRLRTGAFSSGVYVVRMKAGGFTASKKLVVVR
jgi:hypothetical protein